jgi:hypothetical protein
VICEWWRVGEAGAKKMGSGRDPIFYRVNE